MKSLLISLCFIFSALLVQAQKPGDKYKESETVQKIKRQVFVYNNGQNHFWTKVGEEKGKEFLLEVLFLEEGDEIVYIMYDQKTPFLATFSSEQGPVFEGLPSKKGEDFELRGSHKIELTGDYSWKFSTMTKETFLMNPTLDVIVAKSSWSKYRNAIGLRDQLEFLIAMAPVKFVPVQGQFIEKDIKETRHKSNYVFQDSLGEISAMSKGTTYKVKLYEGVDEAAAQKVRDGIEPKMNEILKTNCLSGPVVDTKPPYSLYKSYYRADYTGCGDEKTKISLSHYLFRGKYVVELEVFNAADK